MKKTILLLAIAALSSTYCLGYDDADYNPAFADELMTEEMLMHSIDCSQWIEDIPQNVEPIHIDPADQLDLRYEEMEWDSENFHFNYLLYPYTDEACIEQASLRYRQACGGGPSAVRAPSLTDLYIWFWCFRNESHLRP